MAKSRIQDDLFNHVNQEWIDQAIIPSDRPTTGGFANLSDDVEKLMINEFNEMVKNGNYPNSYLERACDLYKLCKNTKKRNSQGIKPVLKLLNKINKLTDISSLNKNLKGFILERIKLPFDLQVETDMKDTSKHCLLISGVSTILPDATYYRPEMEQQKNMMIGLWSQMMTQIYKFTPLSEDEQALFLKDTLEFDSLLAQYVKTSQEWSEYTKMYNPMKLNKVCKYVKPIKLKGALTAIFGEAPETIIVAEPRYFENFSKVFNEETFSLYKHWAYSLELLSATKYLSEELRSLGSMYQLALMGIEKASSIEKQAYGLASTLYAEPVGVYYGDKYFGQKAKKDVVDMVTQIIETYKDRVKHNDILSEPTKEKAILKLSTMKVKMGYPDKVDSFYDLLVFDNKKSLFEVVSTLGRIKQDYDFSQLNKPVDRSKWVMAGHIVNACYNPFSNDITFPAAILQAPFYSIKQTRSQNLGGIGAVIGHEISHAFDNNGAKCDENGNLNNWWTKVDEKNFKKKTQAMINQFEGIELPWGKVNATLIVSENIADNGGMACTLQIMSNMKDANYEEYFINWAKVWCIKAKPEYQALLLNVDVHGPAILRTNMPPRNFPEWYETFGVKKTDQMYIAPNKRVVIW